jgi:hypothetical protein
VRLDQQLRFEQKNRKKGIAKEHLSSLRTQKQTRKEGAKNTSHHCEHKNIKKGRSKDHNSSFQTEKQTRLLISSKRRKKISSFSFQF